LSRFLPTRPSPGAPALGHPRRPLLIVAPTLSDPLERTGPVHRRPALAAIHPGRSVAAAASDRPLPDRKRPARRLPPLGPPLRADSGSTALGGTGSHYRQHPNPALCGPVRHHGQDDPGISGCPAHAGV